MEIQQIVLIILGILYFIFRARGSSKKKKSAPSERPSKKRTTSIEDILRELSGETALPPPARTPQKEPVVEVVDSPEIAESKKERPVEETLVKDVNHSNVEKGTDTEFDLRKAIIYDAILNRPHR